MVYSCNNKPTNAQDIEINNINTQYCVIKCDKQN
jgi:hypothetical protein